MESSTIFFFNCFTLGFPQVPSSLVGQVWQAWGKHGSSLHFFRHMQGSSSPTYIPSETNPISIPSSWPICLQGALVSKLLPNLRVRFKWERGVSPGMECYFSIWIHKHDFLRAGLGEILQRRVCGEGWIVLFYRSMLDCDHSCLALFLGQNNSYCTV